MTAIALERPRTGRGTLPALLALATGGFAIGTTEFATMSLLPEMAAGLGVDAPTAGHVISAYAAGVVAGAPAIAVLAARLPQRTVLIGLMALFALANAASALAPSLGWMILFRFLSGLPHGAYFGVGSLLAASLVSRERRAQAVSRMMLGLTVATIVGVPLANTVGHALGWRTCFALVTALAALTAVLVAQCVPAIPADRGAGPWRELGALRRPQVWLTLAIGAIGFGGMFCVYTYLASTMAHVTAAPQSALPLALALFGLGMTLGTIACAWAADRAQMQAAGAVLLLSVVVLALYPAAAPHLWSILPIVFCIGCTGGFATILQTRLMDIAGHGQTLAAALNHSAFNTANALGPWLGGIAIAAGFGWQSTGWVGAGLSLAGLAIWAISYALDRRPNKTI